MIIAARANANNLIGITQEHSYRAVQERAVIIHIKPDYSARPFVHNIVFVSTMGDPETAQTVTRTVTPSQSSNWARAFNKFGFVSDLRGGYQTTESEFNRMCQAVGISNPLV